MRDSAPYSSTASPDAAREARDAQLVSRIRSGDVVAFEIVFREYAPALTRFAHALTESKDAAEEIVQELFFDLWRRRSEASLPMRLDAYLYTAVRNRSRNYRRHQRIVRLVHQALGRSAPHQRRAPRSDESVAHEDLARATHATLSRLPTLTREIFVLNREQMLTYHAIAVRLGIGVKAVEYHMGRAFRALRDGLAEWHPPRRSG